LGRRVMEGQNVFHFDHEVVSRMRERTVLGEAAMRVLARTAKCPEVP